MYKFIRPLLFSLDPETAHHGVRVIGTIASLPLFSNLLQPIFQYNHPSLETNVAGISFSSPIGLAAGFDKNAEMLKLMELLGFGFLEIGSVTAKQTIGNPKPRLFRLVEDQALINRMGLCNDGVDVIGKRMRKNRVSIPIGINIAKTNDLSIAGMNAIEDYLYSLDKIQDCAEYVTLNISCPNTPDGKTFEAPEGLNELLYGIRKRIHNNKRFFLKLSADLSFDEIGKIIEVGKKYAISGYVLCNTSLERKNLRAQPYRIQEIGRGGLSGAPIRTNILEIIRFVYKNFDTPDIIGVGGIFSAEDAYATIKAGASLVQIYTSLVYEGPYVVRNIKKGLVELMHRDGFTKISQVVGCEAT